MAVNWANQTATNFYNMHWSTANTFTTTQHNTLSAVKYLIIPKPNMIVQESKMEDVINEGLALRVVERSAENLDADDVQERGGLGRQMCVTDL